ncbi:MAG TPA: hypothetical protein VHX59_19755 [Mycobacteriales bacterium]|nr:hypothetical protein [Mycobacteriales bacterium]
MSDILENGPRRPKSRLRYGALILVGAAVVAIIAVRAGQHRSPEKKVAQPVSRTAAPYFGPAPTAPPAHQLKGVPLGRDTQAELLLAGSGLATVDAGSGNTNSVFALNLQALQRGSFITALVRLHGGVAASVTGVGGSVLLLNNHGSTVRTIASAPLVAAAADDSDLWLLGAAGDAGSTAITRIDESGRVLAGPTDIPLGTVYRGTPAGLVGYSARAQAVEVWNTSTGKATRIAAADPHNSYLDGTADTVAWTDDSAACHLHCIRVAQIGDRISVRTITLPAGYLVSAQLGAGAISRDGTRLAVVADETAHRDGPLASRAVLSVDLASGATRIVPGTAFAGEAADVRLSLAWDPDGRALWIADSDDRDAIPAQLGRWPLGGPLEVTTTRTSEVGTILRLDP